MGLCLVVYWYIAGSHMQLYATPNLRYWPLGVLRQIYAIGLKGLKGICMYSMGRLMQSTLDCTDLSINIISLDTDPYPDCAVDKGGGLWWGGGSS